MTKTYATYLTNHVVVDRSKLQKLSTAEFTDALKDLYEGDLYVKIVDSSTQFFSKMNLKRLLDDPSGDVRELSLILEQRGVILTQEEFDLLKRFKSLRENLLNSASGSYPFAEVPEGWSVENNITFNKPKTAIRRKGSNNYSIGQKALQGIWNKAAPWWVENGEGGNSRSMTVYGVRASGYNRDAEVKPTHIQIGCQRVERYEIEQLASYFGWDFPDA